MWVDGKVIYFTKKKKKMKFTQSWGINQDLLSHE